MDVISNSAARYVRLREEEMSLDEFLALCQRDPMVYEGAAHRMLAHLARIEHQLEFTPPASEAPDLAQLLSA